MSDSSDSSEEPQQSKNKLPKDVISRLKHDSHELAVELKKRIIDPAIHLSNEHLENVDQSYASHFVESFLLGCKMFFGGSLAMIHAVFPFIARDCSSICQDITSKLKND